MPRYHFIVQDGGRSLDPTGTMMDGVDVARTEAARLLGHLLIEDPAQLVRSGSLQVIVANEAGAVLFGWSVCDMGDTSAGGKQPANMP